MTQAQLNQGDGQRDDHFEQSSC